MRKPVQRERLHSGGTIAVLWGGVYSDTVRPERGGRRIARPCIVSAGATQRHMKRTDLEKNLGLKIRGQMQHAAIPGRFAQGSAALPDRKEQRKLDQAAGLVPFAVKLHGDLARRLHELAQQEGVTLNALTDRLIRAGLGDAAVVPSAKAAAKKVAIKKAPVEKAPAEKVPAKKAAAKKTAPAKAAKPKA